MGLIFSLHAMTFFMGSYGSARRLLQDLTNFEGGTRLVCRLPEPQGWAKPWTEGTNSASSTRTLRTAMPIGMATDILYNAALKHCEKFANFPKRPQPQPLSSQMLDLRGTFFGQPLRCKTIELPLNYHKTCMVRHASQIPSKRDDHGEKLQHIDWFGST